MDKPRMIAHAEKPVDYTIFDVKWVPCSAKFIALGSKAKGTGILQIYELNSGQPELIKTIEKKSAFKCGSFGASNLRDRYMAIGDFSGKLQILDLERPEVPIYNVKAHNGILNSIDGIGGTSLNCAAPEIVTGGRDGSVKVWDQRQCDKPVININAEKSQDNNTYTRDCWTVAFGNSYNNNERVVAAGYDNGDVKIFDLKKLSAKWETSEKNGICSIEFDRNDIPLNKMGVTTLEGGLHIYDMRTQHSEHGYACVTEKDVGRSLGTNGIVTGSKATVWAIKHLPQNRDIFLTCGGTGSVRLWNYIYPSQRRKEASNGESIGVPGKLEMLTATTISTQPINSFDWSPDKLGLAVCGSFDQTIRVLITTKLNYY